MTLLIFPFTVDSSVLLPFPGLPAACPFLFVYLPCVQAILPAMVAEFLPGPRLLAIHCQWFVVDLVLKFTGRVVPTLQIPPPVAVVRLFYLTPSPFDIYSSV